MVVGSEAQNSGSTAMAKAVGKAPAMGEAMEVETTAITDFVDEEELYARYGYYNQMPTSPASPNATMIEPTIVPDDAQMQLLLRVDKSSLPRKAKGALTGCRGAGGIEMVQFLVRFKLAVCVAVSVLLTRLIFLHKKPFEPEMYLFPDDYYIGGLLGSVLACYAVEHTIGGTLQKIFRISLGICIAIGFCSTIFYALPQTQSRLVRVDLSNPSTLAEAKPDEVYYVSVTDLCIYVPLMTVYTFVMFVTPFNIFTQKFANKVGLDFALQVLNPMDPVHINELRHWDKDTLMLLKWNMNMYGVTGFVGLWTSMVVLLLLYRRFALKLLVTEMKEASKLLSLMYQVLVETYCLRSNKVDKLEFVRMKLQRLRVEAKERLDRMNTLLDSAWYEDTVGLSWWFDVDFGQSQKFVSLYDDLLKQIAATIQSAIELEHCDAFHLEMMKLLQEEIQQIQLETSAIFATFATSCHRRTKRKPAETEVLETRCTEVLIHLDKLMDKATVLSIERGLERFENSSQLGHAMPTFLFMYSFHALVERVCGFATDFCAHQREATSDSSRTNQKPVQVLIKEGIVRMGIKIRDRLKRFLRPFILKSTYTTLNVCFALRSAFSTSVGMIVAAFMLRFNSRLPSAIALVVSNRLGGTFTNTLARLCAILLGNVMPTILQYLVCVYLPHKYYIVDIVINVMLVCFLIPIMYMYLGEGFLMMVGRIAPFTPIIVLVGQFNTCCPQKLPDNMMLVNYDTLTQTLLGMVILLVADLLIRPTSARSLLRERVHHALEQSGSVFDLLFRHHLSIQREDYLSLQQEQLHDVCGQVRTRIPKLIQEQQMLIDDAALEPSLWWPALDRTKYTTTADLCRQVNDQFRLLIEFCEWKQFQINSFQSVSSVLENELAPKVVTMDDASELFDKQKALRMAFRSWQASQDDILRTVYGTLHTIWSIYKHGLEYEYAAKTAAYMELKEAFRRADKTVRMSLNQQELTQVFLWILPNLRQHLRRRYQLDPKKQEKDQAISCTTTREECEQVAKSVMQLGDKDKDGLIGFDEFIEVLENNHFRLQRRRLSSAAQRSDSSDSLQEIDVEQALPNAARDTVTSSDTDSDEEDTDTDDEEDESVPFLQDDLLYVESYTINEAAANFKKLFCELVLLLREFPDQDKKLLMREVMWMSCVICTTDQLAVKLTRLNTISVS